MTNSVINLSLSTGATIPMRPFTTKAGGTAWCVKPKGEDGYKSSVKVTMAVLGGSFPKSVTVGDTKLDVRTGTTEQKLVKGKDGKPRVSTPAGLPKFTATGLITVNGEQKRVTLWGHDYGDHVKLGGSVIGGVINFVPSVILDAI